MDLWLMIYGSVLFTPRRSPRSLDAFEAEAQRAPSEVDLHGKPVVPVTYASCSSADWFHTKDAVL